MGSRLFTNNPSSLTASLINPADTQVTVSTGEGALFPSPAGGTYAVCTLEDVSGNIEIVHMTARAGDLCTITRAREGTVALTFTSGSRFEMRITRGVLESFLQKDGDTITGTLTLAGGVLSGGRYQNGEVVNTPIRGDAGVTTNQFLVPSGGGSPTIGGQVVYHTGNLTTAAINPIAFKTGMVMMWYGSLGALPTGWVLCDGSNGTPDMRGRFVIGAGGAYTLGATGGAETKNTDAAPAHTHAIQGTALTVAQLPAHRHSILYRTLSGYQGGNQGFYTMQVSGGGGGAGSYNDTSELSGQPNMSDVGSGEAHVHGMDGGGAHAHTVDVRPPYLGLYFIMKT